MRRRVAGGSVAVVELMMVDLDVEETSGVDHPAHLDEGWLVVKEAKPTTETKKADDPGVAPDEQDVVAQLKQRIRELEAQLEEARKAGEPVENAAPPVEELVKEAPEAVSKAFDALTERVEKAEKALAAAEDEKVTAAADAFAKSLDRVKVDTALVKSLRMQAPDLAAQVEQVLKAADEQIDATALFKELGSNTPVHGDAGQKWEALAKAKVDAGDSPTIQQARAAVIAENPDLYNEMKG